MNKDQALQADIAELKSHLEISFVMSEHGHEPEIEDQGKLHYLNPFRDDTNPSFDVFSQTIANREHPEARYGDYAEGTNGDVLDLLGRFHPELATPEVYTMARELLAKQIESEWDGPTVSLTEKQGLDFNKIEIMSELGRDVSAGSTWFTLTQTRPGLTDVQLPRDRVFLHPESDSIVYLLRDEEGLVRGVRFRWETGSKSAMTGSANILMRLAPPQPDRPVFLCEGETDTWAAYGQLGDEYEVLGVPGVGNHPEKTAGDALDNRIVFIAFDPDPAGAAGRATWMAYLASRGCRVHVIVLPEGTDVASMYPEQIAELPDRARHLPPVPKRIVRDSGVYAEVVGKNGDVEPLSNWSFEPSSVLVGEDGDRAYRGVLLPHGKVVTLPATALTTMAQLKAWGSTNQLRWFGSDRSVQYLAALLDHEAAYLPEGRYTNQLGLHHGTFVWGDDRIGTGSVEYLPTESNPYANGRFFIRPKKCNVVEVFEALMSLQHPAVMGPMLAWTAAAPIRSRFEQFPLLSVTGVSGTGKTTLSQIVLRIQGGSELMTTLTATTPYAVECFLDGSNGVPLHIDEYRPGAKMEAKARFDQFIRDMYTGQTSFKGGANESNRNLLRQIRTQAPVLVSGEDNFTETSHTDRMVLVRLQKKHRGDLAILDQVDWEGYAHAYLTSLTRKPNSVDDPAVFSRPALVPVGIEGLAERQLMNLSVLRYGWGLLEEFLTSHQPGYQMPELDYSVVVEKAQSAGQSSPVLDLVKLCLENTTYNATAWVGSDGVHIHPSNLLAEARNHPSIILPTSNAQGIAEVLIDQYDGERSRMRPPPQYGSANPVRTVRIPLSSVDLELTQESDDDRHQPEV